MPRPRRLKPRSEALAALGEALRLIRTENGQSQEEVAEGADPALPQVGGIERGVRNPTYETLMRLAEALDTSGGEIATLADRIRSQSDR